DRADLVLDHQPLGVVTVGRRIRAWIIGDRNQFAAADTSSIIHFFDRKLRALKLRLLDDRHEAGPREENSDPPWRGRRFRKVRHDQALDSAGGTRVCYSCCPSA